MADIPLCFNTFIISINQLISNICSGFGGFGAASSSGGLFGAQAKPAFSFGGTSTANTGFGGLGAAPAGGSLFSSAAKPGGMFGATTAGFGGTTGFGGGTSGFGTANTGFGGGGLNFGAAAPAQNAAAAPATANSAVQQQLLMALQSRYKKVKVCKLFLFVISKRNINTIGFIYYFC